MTNKEILQKAIEKAEKNGYCCEPKVYSALFYCEHFSMSKSQFFSREQNYRVQNTDESSNSNSMPGTVRRWHSINDIIFSHKFAKAFWNDDISCIVCNSLNLDFNEYDIGECKECGFVESYYTKNWGSHLQQMILEEEPLKYLEKFL